LSKLEDIIVKKSAAEFRRKHGLSSAESINLYSLLLDLNVLTVFLPLKGVSGMAAKLDSSRFILINANHAIGRQNFTLCHELYHLFIQENFVHQYCNTGLFDRKNPVEFKADLFASHLLIPEEGVERLLPEDELTQKKPISLATMLELSQYFGCSFSALRVRLQDMGFHGFKKEDNLYKSFSKDISKKATEYGYDTALYKSGNYNKVIGDYGVLARQYYEQDKISESRYAELMNDIFVNIYTPQSDEQFTE
jgi:Zn-dependent peptidase ImmA (M78 family)